jgi:branched-chain amino acid transport system substrate-binding protein
MAALAVGLVGCNNPSNGAGGETPTGSTTAPGSGGTSARKAPPVDGPKVEGDVIKIGLVASMSGDNKPWGEDSYEGAKLAVEEINAAGGIQGKKVELLLGDSASKQEQAKTAAEDLMSKGAIALVGEVSSGNTIQMAKSAFPKGVPVVAIGATRTDLTDEGSHVFRVCYTDDFQGPVMAQFAYEKLGLRKVGVMTDNNLPYSQGLSKSFIEKFKALGGDIVAEKFYESGGKQAPQYSGILTELKALNPDGLFLSGYFTEVGPIASQAKAAGLNVKLLGGDGWDSPTIIESGGDAILGGYFCNHYTNDDVRPQVKAFLDMWRKAHSNKLPNTTMGALGYDAMMLTLTALKQAKELSAKGLIEALDSIENYPAVSGDITLKGMGGNPSKRAIVVEVQKPDANGTWTKFAIDYTPDQIK